MDATLPVGVVHKDGACCMRHVPAEDDHHVAGVLPAQCVDTWRKEALYLNPEMDGLLRSDGNLSARG